MKLLVIICLGFIFIGCDNAPDKKRPDERKMYTDCQNKCYPNVVNYVYFYEEDAKKQCSCDLTKRYR